MTATKVFLSHNATDKPAVEALAQRLNAAGVGVWLDKWNLIPGDPWQPALEKALGECSSCAVFIGADGFGPWHNEEMRVAIDRRVGDHDRRFRVIPVLLPHADRPERSKLPTFLTATTWVEFRSTMDDPEAFHRLICGIKGIEPGPSLGPSASNQCPFRGLRYLDVADAPFFFGREALTEWLLNELRPVRSGEANRFLAIVGASGSGKSSLARAGLLAALMETHDGVVYRTAICRPGANPLENLAIAITGALSLDSGVAAVARLIAELGARETALHLTTRLALAESPQARLVLLVDQFEETFTESRDNTGKAFVDNLVYAAQAAQGQAIVALTLRADFYGRCAAHPQLAAALSDHHVLVGAMSVEEIHRAIERPASLVGCELEPGLGDLLASQVEDRPGALPLLQDVLLELWNRRVGQRLTIAALQSIGGIERALERRAHELFESFTPEYREACRRLCLRLCQPGETTEDTRRRATVDEILVSGTNREVMAAVLQDLADARLVTVEGDAGLAGATSVEITHEALMRSWPQLRMWLDTDRTGRRTHHRLTDAAEQWQQSGRQVGDLFAGARLAVTRDWAKSHADELSNVERDFLLFSEIEHGAGRVEWLPAFTDFNVLRRLLAPILDAVDPAERRKGVAILPTLASPAIAADVRLFLFTTATRDASVIVRFTAAEALYRHGHGPWLTETLTGRPYWWRSSNRY